MWLCIHTGRRFEEAFENTHGEKSSKCNLLRQGPRLTCDGEPDKTNYASSHAGNLRIHLKTHSGEKSNKCNQCNFASTWPADLRIHFKSHSGEKSIDAASVIMRPLEQATLRTTWKRTIEFSSVHSKSLRLLLIIHSGEKSNQCNQCHFVCCALRQGFWHLQIFLAHQKYQCSAKYSGKIFGKNSQRIRIRILFGLRKSPEYEYE